MSELIRNILFEAVIFFSNVMQGITGFAGTVLAMPESVRLVGYATAKPILNVLGIVAGLWMAVADRKYIDKKEFLKIIAVMLAGIFLGFYIKNIFAGQQKIMYISLGVIVCSVGIIGIIKNLTKRKFKVFENKYLSAALLVIAGIVHGIFVCGGPLLVGYLTTVLKDKSKFRATISSVWVVLNTVILFSDIHSGYWVKPTEILLIPSVVVLFAAVITGSVLYKKMSRDLFVKITYVLLIISGAALFFN